VLNKNCLLIPDGKGNNRLDSLVNIVETGDIGCLFLIPGVDETLRVNGVARISTAADHLSFFSSYPNAPKTCIELTIKEVFLTVQKRLCDHSFGHLSRRLTVGYCLLLGK